MHIDGAGDVPGLVRTPARVRLLEIEAAVDDNQISRTELRMQLRGFDQRNGN